MTRDTIAELTEGDFATSMSRRRRERLMAGKFRNGADVVSLRQFIGLTQAAFADALGISVATLRNWEQDRRRPEGPALALLRTAARHPRILRGAVKAPA